jgi:hypothetical protein
MKSLNCCFRDLLTFFLPNDAYQHSDFLLYKETWIFCSFLPFGDIGGVCGFLARAVVGDTGFGVDARH